MPERVYPASGLIELAQIIFHVRISTIKYSYIFIFSHLLQR